MTANIAPLSITISPRDDGQYKSISKLTWDNVPGFAVLTGKNGSGKTQLLELLAYHYSGAVPQAYANSALPVIVQSQGVAYSPDEIGYVPSSGRFSGGGAASVAALPNVRQQALEYVKNAHAYRHDITLTVRVRKMLKRLEGRNPHQIDPIALAEILKDDFDFALDDVDVTEGLCSVFVAHRLKILEGLERGTPGHDRSGEPLGPAPWDVVNESLLTAGFPYEVVSPSDTPIMENYLLRLRDLQSDQIIPAIDLSSGEKVLLQLVLWLFTAGKQGAFPKLLLLDEPDAHLHPSMTQQFLDVISEILVNKYGVRVIVTTHSPSTVALAPDSSVFFLERGATAVLPVPSRSNIISILTAGLVTVSRASKFCFVEDENDVAFYETIREVLSDYGPSKDPMALQPSPSIAFIAASVGLGASKISGGSSVVAKWVNKLDTEPLDRTFAGIIDYDNRNVSTTRIRVIGRYSFENYLLDPLIIFALLVEEGRAPTVSGPKISPGDEHLLRTQDSRFLQQIADAICAKVEAAGSGLATQRKSHVYYTTGQTIEVPDWVLFHRGHDLLSTAQKAFGGPGLINQKRLLKAVRRCRLIPKELAVLLTEIQAL